LLDIFSHNNILYKPTDAEAKEGPSFFETVGASMGYQYAPIVDWVKQGYMFRDTVDESFRWSDHIQGYEAHQHVLYTAKNLEHMNEMKRALDDNIKRRETLAEAGFFYNMAAGVLDPVNVVSLPFGGAGVGIVKGFMRTGASMAAIQAGQEAYRAPIDPLSTEYEVATNIATAFIAGGVIGSALSVPATRRANALKATNEAIEQSGKSFKFDVTVDKTRKEFAPTANRPLSQVNIYDIEAGMQVNENQLRIVNNRIESTEQAIQLAESELAAKQYRAATGKEFDDTRALEKLIENKKKDLELNKKARDESLSEYRSFKEEFDYRNATEEDIAGIDNALGMKKSLFTDSFVFKFVTNPMKRVLQNDSIPQSVKRLALDIAGDSGLALNLHKKGYNIGASVYQRAAIRDGEWVQIYDKALRNYGEEYGKGGGRILDYNVGGAIQKGGELARVMPKQKSFEDWMDDTARKRILGEEPATKAEAEFIADMDRFYQTWEGRLNETGMLENDAFIVKDMIRVERELEIAKDKFAKLKGPRKKLAEVKVSKLEAEMDRLEFASQLSKRQLDAAKEPFNPRYWRQDVIKARRGEFEGILFEYYSKNPNVYMFDEFAVMGEWSKAKIKLREATKKGNKRSIENANAELAELEKVIQKGQQPVALAQTVEAVAKRAKDTVDEILKLSDPTDPNVAFYGTGRPRHTKHRTLDIPNSLVVDFIETNPMSVMKAYTAKIAPQYEFKAKLGKGIEDKLDDIEDDLYASGKSEREVNAILKDIRHLDERVKGTVIRKMDALSTKTATMLKDAAMLNYLGSAGLATLPDYAKVLMEHELGATFKTLFGAMSDSRIRMNMQEGRIAGEILDIIKGDTHLRLTEMLRNNPLQEGYMSKVRNGYFFLNGVAPSTNIAKRLDSMVRTHTLIDYSVKWANKLDGKEGKKASDFEIEYLSRYNISARTARAIAKMPWEQTETGLYIGNTTKWTDQNATESFRSALNSGIANTVLMGGPADKPIAVDGVFYIPWHIANKFGMKQDPKFKGYARVENQLLGLPFQFMSYSFAAANKITAAVAQNQVRNKYTGLMAAMGLGYMSMELRYSDWQMDQMTISDKIARAFDASGYMAIWSDLFYTAMSTSAALDGPDLGMGILNPKFPQEPNVYDAVVGVAGAAPSWALDTGRAMREFLEGNYSEGTALTIKQMPTANLWFLKNEVNEMSRAIRGYRF